MSKLFQEFQPVSAKEWKQKIQVDLKGADYNEALVWQSLEGIHIKPFYHRDDFPNGFPMLPKPPKEWRVGQAIFIDDTAIANNLMLEAIQRGAEAVTLSANTTFDMEKVFENFPFSAVSIYFHWEFLDGHFLKNLMDFLARHQAKVYYNLDILHHLAKEGNWFFDFQKDHFILEALVKNHPSENLLSVDTSLYQNAGANMIQQLAYALAHANEYLNHFETAKDLKITFKVSVGSNYFFEIAKLRALRWLYASLASEYKRPEICHILVYPSKRNKTIYDYNVNMLRTTTECMSAVLGGAHTVTNLPYDAIYHKSNEFGERISRNQLLILKNESYFDWVSNPAEGNYYIESLTEELAQKALAVFKEIENGGGFLHQLKEGILQKKIKESAQKEQDWFDTGKLVLVGTNKYPNPEDRMKEQLELFPFVKNNPRKTLIEPIIERRLAEKTERERINEEV